jgi:hypothetical protein
LLDGITPGEVVDWITYASLIPIFAGTHLIGLLHADVEWVRFWSDALEKLGGDLTFQEVEAAAADLQSLQPVARYSDVGEATLGSVGVEAT